MGQGGVPGVFYHEGEFFCGGVFGGKDEVAFVFAVGGVEDEDWVAGAEGGDGGGNAGEGVRGWHFEGEERAVGECISSSFSFSSYIVGTGDLSGLIFSDISFAKTSRAETARAHTQVGRDLPRQELLTSWIWCEDDRADY